MANRRRPENVLQQIESGEDVLLVCAYDDLEKCRSANIPDMITLDQFRQRLPRLSPQQEIVFACA